MKKLFILMFVMILLVGTISAWDWDNLKSYDEELKEITITNALGLGKDITKIKLNSDLKQAVGEGYRKVAEYEINSVQEAKVFISSFELQDVNNGMKPIEKDLDFKVKVIVEQIVPEYKWICEDPNPEDLEGCYREIVAEHKINKTTWELFDKVEFEVGEIVTIGIFTIVELGEHVEWIPTFTIGVIEDDGKDFRVEEWASWYVILDADLFASYNFETDTSDGVGTYANIELNDDGVYGSRVGKIGNAQNSSCIAGNDVGFNNFKTKTNDDWTICFWTIMDTPSITRRIFGMDSATVGVYTADHSVRMVFGGANAYFSSIFDGGDTGTSGGELGNTDWILHCQLRNETGYYYYLNNTLQSSDTAIAGVWVDENNAFTINSNNKPDTGCINEGVDGVDEWLGWNRGLSQTELGLVWNGGAGVTYEALVIKSLLSSPIDYFNTSDTTPDLSCNFTGADVERITDVKVLVYDSGDNLDYTNTESSLNYISYNKTWTTTILTDGIYKWACLGTGNTSTDYDGNRTFTIDTTAPVINITSPPAIIDYHISGNNLTLNWTVSDSLLQSCWYNQNTTNLSVPCSDNSTQFIVTENSNKNLTFYSNDSLGNEGSKFTSWNIKVIEINQTYNNETLEGSLETFLANIRIGTGFSIENVLINYNNVPFIGQSFANGLDTTLRKENLLISSVGADINLSFYWGITLSDSTRINLTTNNQTVYNLNLDNCSTFTNELLNFTVVDEEKQTVLPNATIEIAVNIYDETRTNHLLNLSDIYERVSPLRICLNRNISASVSYSLDSIIRYEDITFANEYYNIVDYTITNETTSQKITLYDLNISDSTEFQLTFTGSDFLPVENALVYVNRQYISENIFKTVELPKTDFNGQTILHLVRNDVVYNVQITKSGEVLGTFENIVAFCDDFSIGDCNIELNAFDSVTGIFDYDASLGIIFNLPEYNETTNKVSFDFITVDGSAKLVSLEVSRNDIFGNRSICNDSLISSGGTLICDVDPSIDESVLRTNIYVDKVLAVTGSVQIDTTNYGVAGYLIMFVMALSFIFMFSGSKTGVLISIIFTLAGSIGLGLVSGNLIGIGASGLWLIVMVIIGIYKINSERRP